MKYGSITNATLANTRYPTDYMPNEGDGATRLDYSDRHPYTVIAVNGAREVTLQADSWGVKDGKTWFEGNPHGERVIVTLRRNGTWIQKGWAARSGDQFIIDKRMAHYDQAR